MSGAQALVASDPVPPRQAVRRADRPSTNPSAQWASMYGRVDITGQAGATPRISPPRWRNRDEAMHR